MPEDGRKSEAERESLPVMGYAPKRHAKRRGIGLPLGRTMYLTAIALLVFTVIVVCTYHWAPPWWSYCAALTTQRILGPTFLFVLLTVLCLTSRGYRRCRPWTTLLLALTSLIVQACNFVYVR